MSIINVFPHCLRIVITIARIEKWRNRGKTFTWRVLEGTDNKPCFYELFFEPLYLWFSSLSAGKNSVIFFNRDDNMYTSIHTKCLYLRKNNQNNILTVASKRAICLVLLTNIIIGSILVITYLLLYAIKYNTIHKQFSQKVYEETCKKGQKRR